MLHTLRNQCRSLDHILRRSLQLVWVEFGIEIKREETERGRERWRERKE